jgi:hypothetical protein
MLLIKTLCGFQIPKIQDYCPLRMFRYINVCVGFWLEICPKIEEENLSEKFSAEIS